MGRLCLRRGLGPRTDEKGAVAVLTALLMVVLMGAAALVVDLGLERVTRADLQALADVVALDLAREIRGGRTQAQLEAAGNWNNASSAVRRSAERNPDTHGVDLAIEVDWGSYVDAVWNTVADPPTAVRVRATASTDFAVTAGSGAVTRTAYAEASNSACYRLGTFVAAVRTGDSTVLEPLDHLLGGNLDLVSYRALAGADVTLADLAAAPVIGSPERLLTGLVSYGDILRALIHVLSHEAGSSNQPAIDALGDILSASASVGPVVLSDVLHVAPTDDAALGVGLNVLDIVGAVRLASGDHFIEVRNIQAGVPGVGFQFTGGIELVSAAELACGKPNSPETIARTAQLEGSLGIEFVNLPSLSIPGLATLQTAKGTGTLSVLVADGDGQLVAPPEVLCGDGTATNPHTFSVAVRTRPASFSLTSELDVAGEAKVSVLQDLGLRDLLHELFGPLEPNSRLAIEAHVRMDVAATDAGGSSVANLSIPPNDVTPVASGTTVHLDPRSLVTVVTDVKIGGKPVQLGDARPLTDAIVHELTAAGNAFVEKTLVPLVGNINNKMIGPVARMVGLRFGGADVYAVGAVCGEPHLRG